MAVVGGIAAVQGSAEPAGGPGSSAVADADTAPLPGVGALPGGASSCGKYQLSLVERDFAIDGTVTAIAPPRFDLEPEVSSPYGPDYYAEVTLRVQTWYLGGRSETVTLHMGRPDRLGPEGIVMTYGIGTRLLVSGVVSDIEGEGLIGQECGATRYYDEATAAEWAAATD